MAPMYIRLQTTQSIFAKIKRGSPIIQPCKPQNIDPIDNISGLVSDCPLLDFSLYILKT